MKAVVLVGGEGTRLRPLTLTTPKQMLPVGGRPMIERVIGGLGQHGITEVVLSLGYRPDAFTRAYPDGRCAGLAMRYAVEPEPLDTAGAIAFAADDAGIDETFLVLNGDVLTGLDVGALIRFHRDHAAEATIALTPVEDPSRFGVVPTDSDGRVIAFIEKPPRDEAPTNLINAGTYVLEPSILGRIPRGRRVSIERETFPLVVDDRGLFALASDADWLDAGTPATYLAANLRYAGPPGPTVELADGAEVVSSVIGEGVKVGAGAVVRESVLFDGSVVGPGARVCSSIIGTAAKVEKDAVVTDLTVIGYEAVVQGGERISGGRVPSTS
ncbi:MAG TPA: NDP-sugar synthase [Acidimicrobiales bacterium]|nr:NDP-sugar synthase [Acidimicrobiales bacterium]